MNNKFIYKLDDKEYEVIVTYKRIKNIIYKYKDDKFVISSPYGVGIDKFIEGLNKFAKGLIKRKVPDNAFFKDDGIYILGEFIKFEDGFINVLGHYILYKNKEDFYKKIKKIAFPYFYSLLEKYRKIIEISRVYNLKLGFFKSIYGCNSLKNNRISLNLVLIHYSEEIISSVIIHELAHDKERNHQDGFYKIVYKYMPNYDYIDKKLRRGIVK
ncbi:MAG: M48 family metallopeptidase [Mollicutes bacterium]|nr:M48 family metallopeptidase [Mollicutes bacterium]MDD7264120.1 DUF45 domain-containing protein [bacterium]MDY4979126.1 YgjP-like metallopeptidase domain-containing protein [Candidatus Onthovivens sp.]